MGDVLLTFSALSESVWFSFLSHFLVSVPWLLSFLFPFLIKVVLLRKKVILRVLEKLCSWASIPVSFLPFCCSLCWFFKSSFNLSLLPVFLHSLPFYILLLTTFLSLSAALFFISWHFCVPLLSIFYFHISCSFWNAWNLLPMLIRCFAICCTFQCHPWYVW